MSLKLKFGKRKLADKKQDQQQHPQHPQQAKQTQENFPSSIPSVSKTPVFSLGSKKKGNSIVSNNKNIYDKIKNNLNGEQPTKQFTQNIKQGISMATKPSLNLRPNLKKNIQILPASNDVRQKIQEEKHKQFSQVPRPTPLFRGKGKHLGIKNQSKEKVIIEEKYNSSNNHNRNISRDVQQNYEGYGSHDTSQPDQESVHLRPDLKRKHKIENKNFDDEASQDASGSQKQQKNIYSQNNQYNQQQVFMPIQAAEINLKPSIPQMSEAKIQKQRKRAKDLKGILNLQIDLYEDFLNISEITKYEVYISKIKSGILKNSNDQAFDQKTNQSVQTLPFDFQDFTNQCPQDYRLNINSLHEQHIQNDSDALNALIMKFAPVIQELIRPSSSVVMPPIFLLAFNPIFRKFITCPTPVFVYETEKFGIIVIGEKLYIANDKINCASHLGRFLVAGLDSGRIAFWSGKNDKGSRFYNEIHQTIKSTNFQLPENTNNQLQRNSIYTSEYKIVSLQRINNEEFYSMDSTAKLVHWKIQENSRGNHLRGIKAVDFSVNLQKGSLIGYQIRSRHTDLFISTSAGILVYNGQQITQRLQNLNVDIKSFQLPKRSNLVFAIYSDCTLCIFDQNYSKQLFSIRLNSQSGLQKIIIPQIQHQNREISIISTVYVSNVQGTVYQIKLLEKSVQTVQSESDPFAGTNQSSIINPTGKPGKKQNSNVIFRGVHNFNGILEMLTLWTDLKCTKIVQKMGVNTQKSVANLKTIIERNRMVHEMLQMDYAIM